MGKLIVAALLSTWIGWTGAFRAYGGDEAVHLECEAFETWGGWVNDTQFMDQMGSPYLLAHGLGRPVENARTTFSVGQSGDYFVTARTKNWTAHGRRLRRDASAFSWTARSCRTNLA